MLIKLLTVFALASALHAEDAKPCLSGQGPLQVGQEYCAPVLSDKGMEQQFGITSGALLDFAGSVNQSPFLRQIIDATRNVTFCLLKEGKASGDKDAFDCVYIDWLEDGTVDVTVPEGMTMKDALILAARAVMQK